ncbi:MAG: hypothetical protein U0797_16165 [Gemmataceae bacterium]
MSWQPVGEGLTSRDTTPRGDLRHRPDAGDDQQRPERQRRRRPDSGRWRTSTASCRKYTRAIAQRAGSPEVIFLGTGDGPPGSVGAIVVSRDAGRTWHPARMPGRANSTIWNFAVHPADPDLVYASSVSGQVYRSLDGGVSWAKLDREFGEVRGLACRWSGTAALLVPRKRDKQGLLSTVVGEGVAEDPPSPCIVSPLSCSEAAAATTRR